MKNYHYIRLLYRITGDDCIPTRTITVIEICKAVRFCRILGSAELPFSKVSILFV
jgi:hypothetical protein